MPRRPPAASLRFRLILLLTACTVLTAALVGWLSHSRLSATLEDRVAEQLRGVRADRAAQLEGWFGRLHREVTWLAGGTCASASAAELVSAFETLGGDAPAGSRQRLEAWYEEAFLPVVENATGSAPPLADVVPADPAAVRLQARYLAGNPESVGQKDRMADARRSTEPGGTGADADYDAAHLRHHPRLAELRRLFGFYDLFLVAPNTLDIVYSVYKETDFATSLRDGPHAGSGLADTVRAALAAPDGAVAVTDFAPYLPSAGAPAGFLAATVPGPGGEPLAVLAAQVPLNRITEIITGGGNWRRVGLGDSGEVYLVGPDGLMRSESRFLAEDPDGFLAAEAARGTDPGRLARLRAYRTTVLQQPVDTAAVTAAAAGDTGFRVVDDYRGVPVYSAFAPLDLPGLEWSILAEMDAAEAEAPADALRRAALWTTAAVCLAAVLLGGRLASRATRPIRRLADAAAAVGSGDYTARVDESRSDEIGTLARSFNGMVGSLNASREEIRRRSEENERLLLNILPGKIATRLRGGEEMIADRFERVSVVFADIVGFTTLAAGMPADELIKILNELFTRFDEVAAAHGVEKIKTIGDEYMAACGIPEAVEDHCEQALRFACGILRVLGEFNAETGMNLTMRVGMADGPVIAGVIGQAKFIYDLWGDTVNTAARMQSHGVPGAVQVDERVEARLRDRYAFEDRGVVEIKGKGPMRTYLHNPERK